MLAATQGPERTLLYSSASVPRAGVRKNTMGFANDTMLASDEDHFVPINEFGDQHVVTVAALVREGDETRLSWSESKVVLSSGTGGGSGPNPMVYVETEDGVRVAATSDQPFVLADGRVEIAQKLAAGVQLMRSSGDPVAIASIEFGPFDGGVHAIAATALASPSLDGHLINVAGLVVGDYVIQMNVLRGQVPTG